MNNTHTRRLTWLLFFGQSLNSAAYIAGTAIGAIVGAALSGQPALAGLPAASFGLGTALGAYPAARTTRESATDRAGALGREGPSCKPAISLLGAAAYPSCRPGPPRLWARSPLLF